MVERKYYVKRCICQIIYVMYIFEQEITSKTDTPPHKFKLVRSPMTVLYSIRNGKCWTLGGGKVWQWTDQISEGCGKF
jgi:hypothetical protein